MNARNGKIARLSHDVREELNERLERSEPGPQILDWLNALPEAQQVLQKDFGGEPVSKQNLSQWRLGGFQEWLARRELWDSVGDVQELAEDLDGQREEILADQVATVLSARYAALVAKWDGEVDDKFEAKARVLNRMVRGVGQLQRDLRRAKESNREHLRELEEEDQQLHEKYRKMQLGWIFSLKKEPLVAEYFGGGELGQKIARYISKLENDVPGAKLDLTGNEKPEPPKEKKRKARKTDKPLEEKEMDGKKVEEATPVQSNPVKAGQSDEIGLGLGVGVGKEDQKDAEAGGESDGHN